MKNVFRIFFLLMLPVASLAQDDQHFLDSMETALHDAANDTIRLDINRKLGFYFQDGAADIGLVYHQAQLDLAKKLNLKLWEADAYQQVAYCYAHIGNLPASYESYMNGFKIAEDPSSAENGWGYHNFSYSKSPNNARQSIVGMIHFEIAGLYGRSRLYDEERYHLFEAMKIGENLQNKKILSLATRDIGVDYFNNNQPDSAFKYFQKALAYYKDSPYQTQSGVILELFSIYYLQEQKFDSALFYSKKALAISIEENKLASMSGAQLLLGEIFKETGQLDSALYYTSKGIETAESINSPAQIGSGNVQLASIYRLQDKTLLAYDHLESGKTLLDSINDAYITRLVQFQNIDFEQKIRLQELEKEKEQIENSIRMYALLAGLGIFLLVALLLYRNNRQKQKANKVLESTLANLKSTQSQLIQAEKMASLGELTAGIAHEIQNPLNFVNNFSEVSTELLDEATEELVKTQHASSPEQAASRKHREAISDALVILDDVKQNLEKITHHGKRADAIVKGMLAHSRSGKGEKALTDLNALAEEYLKLSYHGLRAKDKSFNADFKTDFDSNLPKMDVIPQDIGRVLLNLFNNAFQEVSATALSTEALAKVDSQYKPLVTVSTKKTESGIEISVADNGNGIPDTIKDKIFQPFFTTKPTGQGTGLGLSMSYDIITKGHGGELKAETEEGNFTVFTISLPTATDLETKKQLPK